VSDTASPPAAAAGYQLWPGLTGPAETTPARLPGSIRRTTTIDSLRPDGLQGDVVLVGAGRDLRTEADGHASLVAEAGLRTRVGYWSDKLVRDLETWPPVAGADRLNGVRAGGGFRRAVDEAVPGVVGSGSLLELLLDEIPVLTLISGAVLALFGTKATSPGQRLHPVLDVCAGWVTGGTMAVAAAEGRSRWGQGPVAPVLEPAGDALAWHPVGPLEPGAMRRRRRLDLVPPPASGAPATFDAMFRDSAVGPEGIEVVVHEYAMAGSIDPATRTLVGIEVTPRVLPGPECSNAVASAQRLVGERLEVIRRRVRDEFTGTPTCTHLNDALRALGDLASLI
jgi:hypothetical protein